MYAAVFEMKSWMGTERHVFTGKNAIELLDQFNEVQSLDCLVRMGYSRERSKEGKASIEKLEVLLDKRDFGKLTIEDLLTLDINISLGTIKCLKVVEGDEEIAKLKEEYSKK